MKIVSIAASFIPSNTANSIQVIKASHALAQLGHDLTLLVPGETKTGWEQLQRHYGLETSFNISWISENLLFRRYDFAIKAMQQAVKMSPDLIYTWALQASVLSLWRGFPTILELHDRVTGKLGPWLFRRFWASKTRKRLLTNTNALRNLLIQDFSLDLENGDIIAAPNGVELERYRSLLAPEKAREECGLRQGFTAGYTGHFYAGRGMNLMYDLAKALPEINFLWVGGEQEDVLLWKERASKDGVQNLTLTGFVDNSVLPHYQAASDVLLMPYGTSIAGSGGGNSAEIASPMKMFEYMAAGRAIMSSDLPVIHEVLDERSAVFCPPQDFLAWKSALESLKEDPGKCQSLGAAARNLAKNYTWQARAEKALDSFEK
jgi:glycosyltransferase involved in cell wall biosynthesis